MKYIEIKLFDCDGRAVKDIRTVDRSEEDLIKECEEMVKKTKEAAVPGDKYTYSSDAELVRVGKIIRLSINWTGWCPVSETRIWYPEDFFLQCVIEGGRLPDIDPWEEGNSMWMCEFMCE